MLHATYTIPLCHKLMPKRLKIILLTIFFIGMLILFFVIYLERRGGDDYAGHFAELLPPETLAFASLHDLRGIWERAAALPLLQEMEQGTEWEKLFASDKMLRQWKKQIAKLEYKTHLKLGREFILKWFGDEAAAAVLPPIDSGAPPGILIMSRTRLGFEEKLAEFVAQYYPDLRLESVRYQGFRINRYVSDEEHRSFSYIRFGRTVFLSLYTSGVQTLKNIADRRLSPTVESLYNESDFREYRTAKISKDDFSIFARPQALRALWEEIPESLANMISEYQYIRFELNLRREIRGALIFKSKTPHGAASKSRAFASLPRASSRTLLFFGIRDALLSEKILPFLKMFFSNDEKMAEGMAKLLKDELALCVERLEPGVILPLAEAWIYWGTSDVETASKIAAASFEPFMMNQKKQMLTPLGYWGVIKQKDGVFISFHPERFSEVLRAAESDIEKSYLWKQLFPRGIEKSRLIVYINCRRTKKDGERLLENAFTWNKKSRKAIEKVKIWTDIIGFLPGIGLYEEVEPLYLTYHLVAPLERGKTSD
ncbi:MAG: hypothetical protein BWY12_02197 [candidate division BRC1 bacterium ADurb.Bin183]|nr:MAG: hypothetical protein BWY12_02197 [candidate division BRC1 bacterium ADurb.Bin183]